MNWKFEITLGELTVIEGHTVLIDHSDYGKVSVSITENPDTTDADNAATQGDNANDNA